MDCSICSSMPFLLRPPRNVICGSCYEAAKNVIVMMNKFENDKANNIAALNPSSNPCKGQPLAYLPKWMNNMKEMEEELNEKIIFLSGFGCLFSDRILTDIHLQPGRGGGPSVPAHRAILAARSEIFKTMLDQDSCKAPANDTITLPELDPEELDSLLEFLYNGTLSVEKLQKHVYSLTLAADKYEIPYMLKFCERHMLKSLDSTSVLDVLEISDVCSNQSLKDTALNYIVRNMEDVAFTSKFEAFVSKNPHLAVHITRAYLMDSKHKRISGD